jgi:nitrile hydratase accessory protein
MNALPLPSSGVPGPEAPVFREPWEAQAFALVLSLHQRGLFTWSEWAAVRGAEIASAGAEGAPDDGGEYYHHWLAALERLVREKEAGSAAEIEHYRHAWEAAAARTPHGQPIALKPEDFPRQQR